MGTSRPRLIVTLACLAFAAATPAAAQPHPVTGIYSYSGPDYSLTVQIHVAPDGTLTGTSRSSRSIVGAYLEGRYEDGRAQGTYYDTTTILSIAFLFEFNEDVLSYHRFAGNPRSPPDPLPEPDYLLRQPGPGPTAPITAPLGWLIGQNRNDTVLATSASGVPLRLADARRYLELMVLAFGEAGISGAPYPNRRIYTDWVARAVRIFEHATPSTQLMLASSHDWWPPLQTAWPEAEPAARRRVAEDALLLLFETAAMTNDRPLLDANLASVAAGCDSLSCRAYSLFDERSLAAARARQPCFNLARCD